MRLSKKEKEQIKESISQLTIVSVKKDGKEIWNCNGKETKISRKFKLEADIKNINVDGIVKEIFDILGKIE